jgi:hypothetical protein
MYFQSVFLEKDLKEKFFVFLSKKIEIKKNKSRVMKTNNFSLFNITNSGIIIKIKINSKMSFLFKVLTIVN